MYCAAQYNAPANSNWKNSGWAAPVVTVTNTATGQLGRCVSTCTTGYCAANGQAGQTGTIGSTTTRTASCTFPYEYDQASALCKQNSDADRCEQLAGQAPNGLTCTGSSCAFYSTNQLQEQACLNGCMVSGEQSMSWKNNDSDAEWAVRITGVTYTGSMCMPGPETPEPGVGETPKKEEGLRPENQGKCPGTVNGVEVWVECGWTESRRNSEKEQETQNPDGSVDKKTEGTTQTTECKGGVCTTTTTTTTTSCTKATPEAAESCETTVTTGASSAGKGAYCQENPGDPQCGDQSAWGGTCAAGFECKGDAVMCATARAVWLEKCALIDGPATATAEQEAYTAAKAGGEGYELTSTTVGIGTDRFSSANALGVAGQCIADLGVVVWGFSLSLPLSAVCSHLEMLGVVMLAVAWLMAAVIVGKGVTA